MQQDWFMRCIKIYLLNKHCFIMVINGKKVSSEAIFWPQMYIFKLVLSVDKSKDKDCYSERCAHLIHLSWQIPKLY